MSDLPESQNNPSPAVPAAEQAVPPTSAQTNEAVPNTPPVIDEQAVERETPPPAIEPLQEEAVQSAYPELPAQFESKNSTQEFDINKAGTVGIKLSPYEEHVTFQALPMTDLNVLLGAVPEIEEQDTEQALRYRTAVVEGIDSVPRYHQLSGVVNRVNADFRQYMQTEKGKIGFQVPRFAEKDAPKVSGDRAVLRVRALLGKGSIISIPLWHSGFWITLRTPSDSAFLEFQRRMMNDKVELGRNTQGLVFSNEQSYTNGWLLDMVIDHLYDSTLKDNTDIRRRIATPDLPILFWGLACAIWPNGYQYSRAVLSDDGIKSKEIITAKIDVAKLMWVDNSSFTVTQKAHMSNRTPGTMTDDSIAQYLNEFPLRKGREVEINENVKITLNVPPAEDYIQAGHRWISDVVAMVDRIFTMDASQADARQKAIRENAQATALRRLGHWIENVIIEDVEHKDRATVGSILEVFSEDHVIRNKIQEEVGRYIDDATVAVIAIPESSGKESGLPRFPRLIPLDVTMVFFTLLMQRVHNAMNN